LLSLDPEPFVLLVAAQKHEDYNFACCFYGYQTWSLTIRLEYMLRIAQITVLGNLFRPRKPDVTGDGRRSHNEE